MESGIPVSETTRQRRKEIKGEAKSLIGQVIKHPQFPHDIRINMSGIKEWLNQPHRHYAEKNEALLELPELLACSDYLGKTTDPKGRTYIKWCHIFKTVIGGDGSWVIIIETSWGEFLVHSVSDNLPFTKEEQDS